MQGGELQFLTEILLFLMYPSPPLLQLDVTSYQMPLKHIPMSTSYIPTTFPSDMV